MFFKLKTALLNYIVLVAVCLLLTQIPHYKEDPIYVFLEIKLHGLSRHFHIDVSVSNLYIYTHDLSTYFRAEE